MDQHTARYLPSLTDAHPNALYAYPQGARAYQHFPSNVRGPPVSVPAHVQHGGIPPPTLGVLQESPDGPRPQTYDEAALVSALQREADDSEDEQNLEQQEGLAGDDADEPVFPIAPPPERVYPNATDLEADIHDWSMRHGYELVRRASKRNAKGELYKRYFHCSKHGKASDKKRPPLVDESGKQRTRANRRNNRMGCPMSLAAVAVTPNDPSGPWQVRHRKAYHNHPPVAPKDLAGHRRRARTAAVEQVVDGLFAINTSISDVLKFLVRSHPDALFKRSDVANMKLRYNKSGTCAVTQDTSGSRVTRGKPGLPSACQHCRAKKSKCDSLRPSCSSCLQLNIPCEYAHDYQAPPAGELQQDTEMPDTPEFDADDGDVDHSLAQSNLSFQTANISPTRPQPPTHQPTSANAPQIPPNANQPPQSAAQARTILAALKSFQQEHIRPARLTLENSSVETLAHASCGTGESYKSIPTPFTGGNDWPTFRDAFQHAAMKENTYEVLMGTRRAPLHPAPDVSIDDWNEYIRQLAIFNRRNQSLLGAINSCIPAAERWRISPGKNAAAVWAELESNFAPRGADLGFQRFLALDGITLASSGGNIDTYAHLLEHAWRELNRFARPVGSAGTNPSPSSSSSSANAPPLPFSETMLCMTFLRNLGSEYQHLVDDLCRRNNIGGLGAGQYIGFRECTMLVKGALEGEATRRAVGRRA